MLFSDSVDNDNNYNDDNSYSNINDNNVGDNDMNNNNSFRKYGLSYPEPSWKNYLSQRIIIMWFEVGMMIT